MARLIRSPTEGALAVVLAVGLALGPTIARADSAAETKAKALYKEGMKAYDVGDFTAALERYSEAYKLAPLPGFLFNLAQCHRQLANYEQAAFFYGRFIDNSKPKAANAELAAQLLAEMKARHAEQRAAEQKKAEEEARRLADAPKVTVLVPNPIELPPPPPPPLAEDPPTYKKWWFWTLVAVGVAAVATGTTVAVVSGAQPQALPTTQEPIGSPH